MMQPARIFLVEAGQIEIYNLREINFEHSLLLLHNIHRLGLWIKQVLQAWKTVAFPADLLTGCKYFSYEPDLQ
jgi:glycerol-3-phosphate responsive antiterminator